MKRYIIKLTFNYHKKLYFQSKIIFTAYFPVKFKALWFNANIMFHNEIEFWSELQMELNFYEFLIELRACKN